MNKFAALLVAGLAISGLGLAGCGGKTGRVKDDKEGDLVGSRKGGIEVYKSLVESTTQKLLAEFPQAARARGNPKIAFVQIENMSAEELGEARESSYELIDTIIVNSGAFTSISKRFVDAGLRAAGSLNYDDFFLKGGIEKFMSVLRSEGQAPDLIMWGKYTSMASQGEGIRQRNYHLTLDLVDPATGITVAKKTGEVRKEYTE